MTTIQFRRGTAAAAAANNVVLAEGEVGYETDTGEWKIGDGVTAWADLDYQPSPADLAAVLASLEDKVDVLDLDTLVAADVNDTASSTRAALSATLGKPVLSSLRPFADGVKMHGYGSITMTLVGMDPATGRLWARDATNGNLSQSDDWGANWTNLRGIPTGTAHASLFKVVKFGGYIYTVLQVTADGLYKVFRAPDVVRTSPLVWEGPLHTMPTNTHINVRSMFNAGSQYLYLGTYTGAGVDDSRIWRTSDGTTWELVYGPVAGIHHVHAVAEDPYNPGHVYATIGDNSAPGAVIRSTNHGASGSWQTIIANTEDDNPWQSVQISFSENWVWMAADRYGVDVVVFDRADCIPYSAATNHHYNIAVPNPAALGDRFYKIGYWGVVDPATESFLLIAYDTSTPGNTYGAFILPHVGGQLALLDSKPAGGLAEAFVGNGLFWSGQWKYRPQGVTRV